ncbi:pyruvate carboxylase [Pochonia chlamydosporia 170]|uniref:Pyruvate carboxylase n=1 Tax=Pochonia chlamydosporia 170 TaxID=1380566 RepID=A0A179G4W4_METCM|nr:pyruvate carboxylase [Pochonia chlamydosporia 170]OAQ72199.1 pyruvate carboxylase [Pochonia chlamydosporia 170]
MALDTTDIVAFAIWLAWNCLSTTPDRLKNQAFALILPTMEVLQQVVLDSQFTFAPGLLEVLHSTTPPAISYFKSLPLHTKVWAVYVLVLKKPAERPKIYIGCCAEKRSGVATRLGQYNRGMNLPRFVRIALDKGYDISHTGLLCWTMIPTAAMRVPLRAAILLLETTFSLYLWAMASRDKTYGVPTICPWPIGTIGYDGCCSHVAFNEGLPGTNEHLSPEQVNALDAARKLQNSRRDAETRGKEKASRFSKITRERNLALKRFACDPCNVVFGAGNQLEKHKRTQKHKDKMAGIVREVKTPQLRVRMAANLAARRYYCSDCDYTAATQQKLNAHLKRPKHLKKSPGKKYNLDYYLDLVDKLVKLDIHVLGIKDMAGVLKPHAATLLIGSIRKKYPDLPIHVHTHDSAGTGVASMVACAMAGADAVDAATDSLSGMTSQPSINAILASLEGTGLEPGLDARQVRALDTYWSQLRLLYSPFEAHLAGPDPEVYEHEIPGGQLTNMMFQASQLGLGSQWLETKKAYEHANDLLGDIVKVTPTSKVVGDLAQFMVSNKLSPEDVKARASELDFPGSVLEFLEGLMGQPYGGFPEPLRSDALRGRRKLDKRPGLFLDPVDFAKVKKDLAKKYGAPVTECDIASYVMYPKVFEDYKKFQQQYGDLSVLPTRYFLSKPEIGEEFNVELEKGKVLILKLLAVGPLSENTGQREVFFEMNGEVRQVAVIDNKAAVENVSRPKADPSDSSQVGAPMSGVLVELRVHEGSDVKKGDPLAVLSAMKMEMVVSAPHSGKVASLQVKEGDSVDGSDLVCRITKA